jgi:hypothetical protein
MSTNSTQVQRVDIPAVTAQYDFLEVTQSGEKLFSVRAGVPLGDAFDQLSTLLSSTIATFELVAAEGANSDDVPAALWQSVHLMKFTYALAQSMQMGLIHHEQR